MNPTPFPDLDTMSTREEARMLVAKYRIRYKHYLTVLISHENVWGDRFFTRNIKNTHALFIGKMFVVFFRLVCHGHFKDSIKIMGILIRLAEPGHKEITQPERIAAIIELCDAYTGTITVPIPDDELDDVMYGPPWPL